MLLCDIHGAIERLYAVHDRIEINAKIMLGKPVIRGTRIPVELIVRKLSEGADEKVVLQAYPRLTVEDIRAAIRYAVDPKVMANADSMSKLATSAPRREKL
jgi:uncharacterized protein (DUF433 family)